MRATLLALLVALAACGDDGGGAGDADAGPGDDGGAGGVDAGDDGPRDPMPIKSVVVIVKENHTLDAYFTGFPGATTSMTATLSDDSVIARPEFEDGDYPCDVPHDNDANLTAYAGGDMNGFDQQGWSCEGDDALLPFRRHTEAQLPSYWFYARNFVLADQFFSTHKGGTTPGHLAVVAAETPFIGNTPSSEGCSVDPVPIIDHAYNRITCQTRPPVQACFDIPSVVDHMQFGAWRSYGPVAGTGNVTTPLNFIRDVGGDPVIREAHFRGLDQLLGDLQGGDQPDLVFAHVYAGTYTGIEGEKDNSEHAPTDPCWGENYTVMLVNAIMQGPRWNETAIVITYDDYGGFYDHVAPKREACEDFNPGFRLPLLIISPYARDGFVLHKDSQGLFQEHASIPKLIEDVFALPRMQSEYENARDGQAGSLLEAFDFTQPPRPPLLRETRPCN